MIIFVLRVAAGRDGPRGTATHVASGEARAFAGQADLWAFLEELVAVDGIGEFSAACIREAAESDPGPDLRGGSDPSLPESGNPRSRPRGEGDPDEDAIRPAK
jgi:hypothetical protein